MKEVAVKLRWWEKGLFAVLVAEVMLLGASKAEAYVLDLLWWIR